MDHRVPCQVHERDGEDQEPRKEVEDQIGLGDHQRDVNPWHVALKSLYEGCSISLFHACQLGSLALRPCAFLGRACAREGFLRLYRFVTMAC